MSEKYLTVGDLIAALERENRDARIDFEAITYRCISPPNEFPGQYVPQLFQTTGIKTIMLSIDRFNSTKDDTEPPYYVLLRILTPYEHCFSDRIIEHT